jgi:glycosyltransferase involved in cell wall biosynthesis
MRIVYVLASLGMGGAERQVIALAQRMALRGHTVALMVLRPPVAEQWPTTVRVIHLHMRKSPLSALSAIARGRRFLAAFQPDLVHSHSFHANIAARLLKIFLPGLPVLSSVHSVNEGGWLRMLAYRLTDNLARRTTAVSQAAADRYVALKAIPPQMCIVVPNGIDTAEFAPGPDRRRSMRARMGVEKEFVWLAAGRIVPAKDYPNLLRAFRQLL